VSSFFTQIHIQHPFLTVYFVLTISIIFSCGGLLAALWANDFGMLSVWNTYIITPAVFLGGVFNSVSMLPGALQPFVYWNPLFYLVSGMRYSILGITDVPIEASIILSFVLAGSIFLFTVHLFRIGYKLRT